MQPSYPQLQRALGTAWWRPLLALLLCALTYALWLAAMWGAATSATGQVVLQSWPGKLLAMNLSMIGLIPASMLAGRLGFGRSAGFVASAAGRLRWRWLLRAWASALLCMAVLVVLDILWIDPHPLQWQAGAPWLVLMVLVLTPLQCAGEEYFFRGLLPQCLGSWCSNRQVAFWLTLLLPALLFALVHGQQDWALFAARLVLGLLFGWLAWRTGGLEASIALHTLNNQASFAETIATGTLVQTLQSTAIAPLQAMAQVTAVALAACIMLHQYRRSMQSG